MALIKCPECGAEISDQAPSCPHCGTQLLQRESKIDSGMDEAESFIDMPWLAFLLPPLGFILYFLRRQNNPVKARTLLIASIIGLAFDIGGLIYWSIL